MKANRGRPSAPDRPRQELPQDILTDLLGVVRRQFCPEMPDKEWFQNLQFFRRVVTWPASWLNKKGVTLPPERYKEILIKQVFSGIQTHGARVVKHWPGYLLHCVQEHFKHQGETYYTEAKAIRAQTERALMAFRPSTINDQPSTDPIGVLAAAHRVLTARKPRKKRPSTPTQPDLL